MGIDHYRLLGLSPPSDRPYTDAEIRRAYRHRALALHPDRCKDPLAPKRFDELTQAYQFLADEQKRAEYDRVYLRVAADRKLASESENKREMLARELRKREAEHRHKQEVAPQRPRPMKPRKQAKRSSKVIDVDFSDDEDLFAALAERSAKSAPNINVVSEPVVVDADGEPDVASAPVQIVCSSDEEEEMLDELISLMKK